MKVWDFLPRFIDALGGQLIQDDKRWGNTWLERKPNGQEMRFYSRVCDYWVNYTLDDEPMPWLKIAGECLIAWIRDNNPEIWEEDE